MWRILDANVNRSREGLRVCEDIARFYWDNPAWTRALKNTRQRITDVVLSRQQRKLLGSRAVGTDVGRGSTPRELKRKNAGDIFLANMQRVKESLRVLEEVMKMQSPQKAARLKRMRYSVYALEKKALTKI